MTTLHDLPTPALVVDADELDRNIQTMARALPGPRLRPHVKAHKCSELAKRQRAAGHAHFCCATVREMEGMAQAGLGEDLLLANEVLDARRLGALDARVTVAVDSPGTIEAAHQGGVAEVLIDVNVGLPRCGCAPEDAGRLADLARSNGLEVRGVMGYEGHIMGVPDREKRETECEKSMQLLLRAHADVGGDVVSAGGTGTHDCNTWASEIQAGSYALMDTAYAELALPFEQSFHVYSTVISVSPGFAVADCGLKSLGMDHGNPAIEGGGAKVWFCSDEHITFAPERKRSVGDRIRVIPAHVDPTVAYHERFHVIRGDEVVDEWPVDLRGW
jgi:D-serine deaminase-like pyridoxal phosphate-dependent protein